jgi:hypothetical protein
VISSTTYKVSIPKVEDMVSAIRSAGLCASPKGHLLQHHKSLLSLSIARWMSRGS